MKLHPSIRRRAHRRAEDGYVLLSILLVFALMIIVAATVVTSITFSLKRDREEEMIHRGVQYSRAIRSYYKKFGRYPSKLEDLESTNKMRFLRKRYKDPLTGKDFKLLRFGDVKLALGAMGGGGGIIPGTNAVGGSPVFNNPGGLNNGGFNSGGGLQNSSLGGANSGFGNNTGFGNSNTPFGQSPAYGQNAQPNGQTSGSDSTQGNSSQGNSVQGNTQGNAGSGPNQAGQDGSSSGDGTGNGSSGDKLSNTQFGGGAIVGVASLSKDPTIREYNHKKKYNEWQFVYDPTLDRGGLITTPYQPMAAFGQMGVQPNLNGQINGTGSSSFGTGQPPAGMQNNPNLPPSGGFGNSGFGNSNPSSPPQQQ